MSVYIHRIETAVPSKSYDQSFIGELMQEHVSERTALRRVIRSVYQRCGIEKRHSVVRDFEENGGDSLFFSTNGERKPSPDTRVRNAIYTREARKLFHQTGNRLLQGSTTFSKEDITHLITVSCTGFFAPGPDYYLIRDLGLNKTIERYHIGFMGCYAAFQGLKMAHSICMARPEAVVMVICVELCTLHLRFSDDTDSIIASSVFADGGAGVLVSSRKPGFPGPNEKPGSRATGQPNTPQTEQNERSKELNHKARELNDGSAEKPGFQTAGQPDHDGNPESHNQIPLEMISFHSDLTSEGEQDMAWTIGNEGFIMKLSTYVPDIIRSNIAPALERILKSAGISREQLSEWAIHPGGRAILDNIQHALDLNDSQMEASRHVLAKYGNMSSATILFVLKQLVEEAPDGTARPTRKQADLSASGQRTETRNEQSGKAEQSVKANGSGNNKILFAMSFGPGLTIETGLFRKAIQDAGPADPPIL